MEGNEIMWASLCEMKAKTEKRGMASGTDGRDRGGEKWREGRRSKTQKQLFVTQVYDSTCNDSSSATLNRDLYSRRDSASLPCPRCTRKSAGVLNFCSLSPHHSLPVYLRLRTYSFVYLSAHFAFSCTHYLSTEHIQGTQLYGNDSPSLSGVPMSPRNAIGQRSILTTARTMIVIYLKT